MTIIKSMVLALIAAIADASFRIGYIIGILLPLIIALSCRATLRRPDTNRKCLNALLLVCLSWMLLSIAGALGLIQATNLVVLLGVIGVGLLPLPAGVALGLMGLLEFASQPGRFRKGRIHAVGTLVMSAIIFMSICIGLFIGVSRREDLGKRFAALANNRSAAATSRGETLPDHHSTTYGYTVSLTNAVWVLWPDQKEEMPAADFGIVSKRFNGLAVIAIHLRGTDPQLDPLTRGFMTRFDVTYPSERIEDLHPFVQGALTGQTFLVHRKSDNGFSYVDRYRVLKKNGFGYLLTAWANTNRNVSVAELDAALDRVRFDPPPVKAPNPAKLSKRELILHAQVLNAAGLHYYDARQYDQALPYFQVAAELRKAEAAYLKNTLDVFNRLNRYQEALDFFVAHQAMHTNNMEVQSWHPYLLSQLDRTKEALTGYEKLFTAGYRDDNDFSTYANLLSDAQSPAAAQTAVATYLKGNDKPAIRLLQARLHTRAKEYDQAIAGLKTLQEKRPFDGKIGVALAENQLYAGHYQETLKECGQLVQHNLDSAYVQYLKGRAELSLKWYREAKVSFEQSLKLDPKDDDTKEYLDHVSGLLGEGSNTSIKEPIEPVPVPAILAEGLPDTPAEYLAGYKSHYLRRIHAISYKKGKELRATDYIQAKVLDAQGVADFSSMQFAFDPLGEAIYPNRLVVKDTNGVVVAEGKLADFYVVDDSSSNTATQDKILHLPVPGLQPGYTVEATVTRRNLSPPKEFEFVRHWFARRLPVRRSALFVSGDTGEIRAESLQPLSPQRSGDGLSWCVDNVPPVRDETLAQPSENYLPVLSLGEASNKWEIVAGEYLARIADRLEPSPAVNDIVRAQTNNLASVEAKTLALARYCQTLITYKAIEFGQRARIPNKPADILHNKYGDCKDHAVLLRQLLIAADIPAHLALAKTSGALCEKLPSLDQFNHLVVYIPSLRGGQCVDITDKETDPALPVPYGLAGKTVLILDPKQPRLLKLPDYPAGSVTIVSDRRVSLTNDVDMAVDETVTLTGYYASYMRSELQSVQAANLAKEICEQMTQGGVVPTIQNNETRGLADVSKPIVIKVQYLVPHGFKRHEGQLLGQLPTLWEQRFLKIEPVPHRQTPFQLIFPVQFNSRISLVIPEGYEAPTLVEQKGDRFASGRFQARRNGKQLEFEFECKRPAGRYAAEDFTQFQKTCESILAMTQQTLVFKPATAVPSTSAITDH